MVDRCVWLAGIGVAVCSLFRHTYRKPNEGRQLTQPKFAPLTLVLACDQPLLRNLVQIKHEDFMEGINVVSAKKKGSLDYYA